MSTRIYVVRDKDTNIHLVRAAHPQQAIGHVVKNQFEARVASQDDLVQHLAAGKKIEEAKPEQAPQ